MRYAEGDAHTGVERAQGGAWLLVGAMPRAPTCGLRRPARQAFQVRAGRDQGGGRGGRDAPGAQDGVRRRWRGRGERAWAGLAPVPLTVAASRPPEASDTPPRTRIHHTAAIQGRWGRAWGSGAAARAGQPPLLARRPPPTVTGACFTRRPRPRPPRPRGGSGTWTSPPSRTCSAAAWRRSGGGGIAGAGRG